jgi:hypothetical protein
MIVFLVGARRLRPMDACFGNLAEILGSVLFMYDGHNRLQSFS